LCIYRADSSKYIYSGVLAGAATKTKENPVIPVIKSGYDHISLYFPNRTHYILSQMNVWIISSIVLLILLIFFGTSLYYFYRQKFLHETQKDLLHSFTHEFKTPVSVLSLAGDVLKDPEISKKPDKLSTYAGIVQYQSAYLQNQIENLLRFAHTESRHLHLRKEKINLYELIDKAIVNLKPLIQEKKVDLQFQRGVANPCFSGDKDYLVIVVMNILDNAIKYSKNPSVQIFADNTGQSVLFSIKDNGIGMDKTQMKNIFRKFFRVHNGEIYTAKGFGIGLSFVQKIVKAHGGSITVESTPGSGSNFIVHFPLK